MAFRGRTTHLDPERGLHRGVGVVDGVVEEERLASRSVNMAVRFDDRDGLLREGVAVVPRVVAGRAGVVGGAGLPVAWLVARHPEHEVRLHRLIEKTRGGMLIRFLVFALWWGGGGPCHPLRGRQRGWSS